MKKLLNFGLGLLGIILISSCSSSGEKKRIVLNLEKGKTYILSTKTTQNITQTIMGFNQEMKTEMEGDIEYIVNDIKDKDFMISSTFGNMKLSMDAGMMKLNSGDSLGTNKIMHDAMKAMKGISFGMRIGSDGKVKSIDGIDSLIQNLTKTLGGEDSLKSKSLNETWTKYFSKSSLGGNFESTFGYLPDQAVGKGDHWEKVMENNSVFPIKIKSKFSIKELTDTYAVIEGKSKIETSDNPVLEVSGIKMKYKMEGDQESSIKVNLASGWIMEAETNAHIKGEVSMDMGNLSPKSGMNLSIPMKIEMKTMAKGK